MKSRLVIGALFMAVLLLVATAPALADTVDFGQLGNGTLAYNGCGGTCTAFTTTGGFELDVTGWLSDGNQDQLYFKNNGGDEVGLGLADDISGVHEIFSPNEFLQLDIGKLAQAGDGSLTLSFNSTTQGEEWGVSYFDTNGVLNSNCKGSSQSGCLKTGTSEGTSSVITVSTTDGGHQYLDVSSLTTSGDGNLLLGSTPEPASLLLLGTGLLGLGGTLRKKGRKA